MLTSNLLNQAANIRHGFFTRQGGHSTGLFDSLNCGFGSGDDLDTVRRNRDICADALAVTANNLLSVSQQHTPDVITVTESWPADKSPVADAMVTRTPGIALAVLAADCAPVLFIDAKNGVVGAAHAGWKGALAGVVDQTVKALLALGAEQSSLMAAVGPCIGIESYEVGADFRTRFVDDDAANTKHFKPGNGKEKFQFDLQAYVTTRVKALGVSHVDCINTDTCADDIRFFSYRRSCLQGESVYGRQLSGIALSE